MKLVGDKELVRLCLEELKNKMGYTDLSKVPQRDLEHLCYSIDEKTKILISLSTMKRVLNEKYERLPQTSTLDALTIFIGYTGWQDFKTKKAIEDSSTDNKPPLSGISGLYKRVLFKFRYPTIAILVIVVVSLTVFRLRNLAKNDDVSFSLTKIVSEGVPSNVIFSYNIDHAEGTNFYIQPSWNKEIRIKISKNNHTQTSTYYEPGFHTAKLIIDDKIAKVVQVHIPTEDWVGYSKVSFFDPYPEYFKKEYIIRDSVLGIDSNGLKESKVDTDKKKIYYYAYFPDSIQLNSNNFRLQARMRMKNVRNTLCPWLLAEVYGEESFFYFIGTTPGCTSEIHARFSDSYLDGGKTDLSCFGFNVFTWKDIEIKGVNKKITISIDNRTIFENVYSKPGGLVKGIGFGSNGLCEVDFVKLIDADGTVSYFKDF
jgi:hypothetical protein